MNTQWLIDKGDYKKYSDLYPNDVRHYLKECYVCQLCEGFRKGQVMNKSSILGHHRRYHSEVK